MGGHYRSEAHREAVRALAAYETGRPFAVFFRTFGIDVLHGPGDMGRDLASNQLLEALRPEADLVSIQDPHARDAWKRDSAFDRKNPALALGDDWKEVASDLIRHADLIVSECYFLSPGVRFELEVAFRFGRWDRTVLILPPLDSYIATIDHESLIQMFPRCVWADDFHTTPFPDLVPVADLIRRIKTLGAMKPSTRSVPLDPDARLEAFPIDHTALARRYETEAMLESQFVGEDPRILYYGFWKLFRAAALRAHLYQVGDTSGENRVAWADDCLQMASIMLTDVERRDGKVVLRGDLDFAEAAAVTAHNLVEADFEEVRRCAEERYNQVLALKEAIAADPDRFERLNRYGPILTKKASAAGET